MTKQSTPITRFDLARANLKLALEALGHTDVVFVGANALGKIQVEFTHPTCGTRQIWTTSNITKRLKIAPNIAPCSKCGAVLRRANGIANSAKK